MEARDGHRQIDLSGWCQISTDLASCIWLGDQVEVVVRERLSRWQKKREPGMQVLKLSLTSIPIWIMLTHLPMEFWTHTCLSYVTSGVGKPLCADSITKDRERLGFAGN